MILRNLNPRHRVTSSFLLALLCSSQTNIAALAEVAEPTNSLDETTSADKPQLFRCPEYMRILATDELERAQYNKAIEMMRSAIVIEPGRLANHLVLARALTEKYLRTEKGNFALYHESINEWILVKSRDNDSFEQDEALQQLLLLKTSRLIRHPRRRSKTVIAKILKAEY